ncbi:transposase [Streptomyces sp. NPDC048496]|uniref:transposase n=1 Tax=Streptomyces sp. NPDC048496 TaxID=3365558 RepID=UPI003717FFCB
MLEPLLPVSGAGRPVVCRRTLIDGVRWRVRTGVPWRDLPAEYGPWQTVYSLFRRWQRGGVWAAVFTALQARADAAGLITWEVNVDSTISRPRFTSPRSTSDGESRLRSACHAGRGHTRGRRRGRGRRFDGGALLLRRDPLPPVGKLAGL